MTDTTEPLSMSDRAKADAHKSLLERAKRAEARVEELTIERDNYCASVKTARRQVGETIAALHEAGIEGDPAAGVRELAAQRDAVRETEALRLAACSLAALDPSQLLNMAPEYDSAARQDVSRMRMELDAARRRLAAYDATPPAPPEEPAPEPRCRVAGSGKHDPAISLQYASRVECGKCGDELPAPEPERVSGMGVPLQRLTKHEQDMALRALRRSVPPVPAPEPAPELPKVPTYADVVAGYAGPVYGKISSAPSSLERCDMGVGCREAGACYAAAHGEPDRCPAEPVGRDVPPPGWKSPRMVNGRWRGERLLGPISDHRLQSDCLATMWRIYDAERGPAIEEHERKVRLLTEHRALCVAALRKVQEAGHEPTFDIATEALCRLDESADGGGL